NARIGAGSKVPHLTYVGDATLGRDVNIGAATIFVNYDGVNKHHTVVEDGAFVGCDTSLIAPVTIGAGAYTAAGSAIAEDVPARSASLEQPSATSRAGSNASGRGRNRHGTRPPRQSAPRRLSPLKTAVRRPDGPPST